MLSKGRLPDELMAELGVIRRVAAPPAAGSKPAGTAAAGPEAGVAAVQLLGMLQREGRLLDFLYEDIAAYSDAQVGAAVRAVHESCRKTLDRVAKLGPVVDGVEGTLTRLESAGISAKDTARVRLVGKAPPDGNVEAGRLQHRGWQVREMTLPPPDAAARARVLAPAEIEVE